MIRADRTHGIEVTPIILDNKTVGEIRKEKGGYRYWPKDITKVENAGELFPKYSQCFQSLLPPTE